MNQGGVMRTLVAHFFRRFFDNDTVHVQGDTLTTVVRAIAIVAAPGLIVAFFLQNAYPYKPFERAPWLVIEDHYFFVLLSFVAMGAVAVVEWEMLFPDRLDFLVLTPLSLKSRQLLASKATALAGFLALFLFSANVFGAVVLPAVSKGSFFRQLWAHTAATALAGTFAGAGAAGDWRGDVVRARPAPVPRGFACVADGGSGRSGAAAGALRTLRKRSAGGCSRSRWDGLGGWRPTGFSACTRCSLEAGRRRHLRGSWLAMRTAGRRLRRCWWW